MKNFICPFCGGTDFTYKKVGPHVGAYCKKDGVWVKWLSKSERKILNIEEQLNKSEDIINDEEDDNLLWN